MSLDVYLTKVQPCTVFDANITHNLSEMAREAGIYDHCWRPEEIGIKVAAQLIAPLQAALGAMEADPERFKKFDASNGWGCYRDFVPWLRNYLAACEKHPDAQVHVSR